MGKDSRQALDKLGVDIDEWLPVAGLRWLYAVCRDCPGNRQEPHEDLVFDEPTAVRAEAEADLFLNTQ